MTFEAERNCLEMRNESVEHDKTNADPSMEAWANRAPTIVDVLSPWPAAASIASCLSGTDLINLSRSNARLRAALHGFTVPEDALVPGIEGVRTSLNIGFHQTRYWRHLKRQASKTCLFGEHKQEYEIKSCNGCSLVICRACVYRASMQKNPGQPMKTRFRYLCQSCWINGNPHKRKRFAHVPGLNVVPGPNPARYLFEPGNDEFCHCSAMDLWLCSGCRKTQNGEFVESASTRCFGEGCDAALDVDKDRRSICVLCDKQTQRKWATNEERTVYDERRMAAYAAAERRRKITFLPENLKLFRMSRRELRGPDQTAGNDYKSDELVYVRHLDTVNYQAFMNRHDAPSGQRVFQSKEGTWKYDHAFLLRFRDKCKHVRLSANVALATIVEHPVYRTAWLNNLPYDCQIKDVVSACDDAGFVTKCILYPDELELPADEKKFANVTFYSQAEALKAERVLHERRLEKKNIEVQLTRTSFEDYRTRGSIEILPLEPVKSSKRHLFWTRSGGWKKRKESEDVEYANVAPNAADSDELDDLEQECLQHKQRQESSLAALHNLLAGAQKDKKALQNRFDITLVVPRTEPAAFMSIYHQIALYLEFLSSTASSSVDQSVTSPTVIDEVQYRIESYLTELIECNTNFERGHLSELKSILEVYNILPSRFRSRLELRDGEPDQDDDLGFALTLQESFDEDWARELEKELEETWSDLSDVAPESPEVQSMLAAQTSSTVPDYRANAAGWETAVTNSEEGGLGPAVQSHEADNDDLYATPAEEIGCLGLNSPPADRAASVL